MEDDKLKDLFSAYNPELSPEFNFMKRLERSMDAMELVRRHSVEMRRRNRRAVVVAACAGFCVGAAFTFLLLQLCDVLGGIHVSVPFAGLPDMELDCRMAAWIAVAGVSMLITRNTYDLAMSRG